MGCFQLQNAHAAIALLSSLSGRLLLRHETPTRQTQSKSVTARQKELELAAAVHHQLRICYRPLSPWTLEMQSSAPRLQSTSRSTCFALTSVHPTSGLHPLHPGCPPGMGMGPPAFWRGAGASCKRGFPPRRGAPRSQRAAKPPVCDQKGHSLRRSRSLRWLPMRRSMANFSMAFEPFEPG